MEAQGASGRGVGGYESLSASRSASAPLPCAHTVSGQKNRHLEMRGGNNIKGAAEKKLAGTGRADRDAARLENFVPTLSVTPLPPRGFDAKHRRKWNETAGKLVSMGVLSEADLDALVVLVQNMVLAENAYESVRTDGMVIMVKTAKGEKPIQNPAFRVYMECQKNVKPLLEQFGMTPKSRQGLKVKEPEQQDPLADLLRGKGKRGFGGPHD